MVKSDQVLGQENQILQHTAQNCDIPEHLQFIQVFQEKRAQFPKKPEKLPRNNPQKSDQDIKSQVNTGQLCKQQESGICDCGSGPEQADIII